MSGQLKAGEASLGWSGRARDGETVVVYMGLSQAAAIRNRLLGDSVSSTLPVALIENGTRPDQSVSAGNLGDLPALAARHGDGPVLLVIGRVAARAKASRALPQRRRA